MPRRVDRPLVLYGYGKLGRLAEEVFKEIKVPISFIYDKSNVPNVMFVGKFLVAVCVASEPYEPICNSLRGQGWTDIVSIYDIFEAYPECGITNGWTDTTIYPLEEGRVHNSLADEWSRDHYQQFRDWHRTRHFNPVYPIINNAFCIPEVIAGEHIYYQHEGSTLRDISKRKGQRPLFGNSSSYILFGTIYSYIQLHLEGHELSCVRRNMPYFKKVRPIIAVTVYHTSDGLWKIEDEMMRNLEGYRFYFRCHAYQGQAAILYCIPEAE